MCGTYLAGAKSQDWISRKNSGGEKNVNCEWSFSHGIKPGPLDFSVVWSYQHSPVHQGLSPGDLDIVVQVLGWFWLAAVLRGPVCAMYAVWITRCHLQKWGQVSGLWSSWEFASEYQWDVRLMAPPGHCAAGAGGLLTGVFGREEVERWGSCLPLPCASWHTETKPCRKPQTAPWISVVSQLSSGLICFAISLFGLLHLSAFFVMLVSVYLSVSVACLSWSFCLVPSFLSSWLSFLVVLGI